MIRWLSSRIVEAVHRELIQEHGGAHGIRDASLLDSALAWPLNRQAYGASDDVHQLAATYGYGLCRNHPFVDGNKRVAFMTMYVFLRLNGMVLTAAEVDAVSAMESLARGSMPEDELTGWVRQNTRKSPRRHRRK